MLFLFARATSAPNASRQPATLKSSEPRSIHWILPALLFKVRVSTGRKCIPCEAPLDRLGRPELVEGHLSGPNVVGFGYSAMIR